MKKVIIKNSINVDVMIEKMKSEIECLNNGYEYDMIKDYIIKNGSGIYEFGFGCRGGLEEFIKNDEYLSIEEVKKTDELVEWMKEYPDAEDVINKAMRK